jgi:hypothetical protein
MQDFIDLGCAPNCEDCAQVGQPDYFDHREQASINYAFRCETGPHFWDEEAQRELSESKAQTPRKETP